MISFFLLFSRCYRGIALALCAAAFSAGVARAAEPEAVPTRLTVRVVAQDAKLIQDAVGGAFITVRDLESGELLAQGLQRGDSGSTDKIMRQAHARGENIYDLPGAAVFSTTLALIQPTRVEIIAEGPLDYPQAMQSASTTLLMVPGKDVVGDGVVLTLHGFIVELLAAADLAGVTPDAGLPVEAQVRMMCGCPTEPGGLWDSNRYEIQAQLIRDGGVVARAPLDYAGRRSTFAGRIRLPAEGADLLRVVVSDPEGVNFGMDEVRLKAQ